VIAALTLVVGLAIGYFVSRNQAEKVQRQEREKADNVAAACA
jgi:uncharacterized membrane-anchored protein YhcB (DUF1043 family)